MSQRSLATIVVIEKVIKHPQADRLNIGQVGGWNVVVGADVQEGDKGVYFEIDSVLPNSPWAQTIKSPIKTMKIRNVLSQGLFLKMEAFPGDILRGAEIGQNVSEILGVTKREDTADSQDKGEPFEKVFPSGPFKTDEPRVQSSMFMNTLLTGKPYYISVKYDGCSMTVGFDMADDQLIVCSRNMKVPRDESHYWQVCIDYDLEKCLRLHPYFVIQCEVYGPKIQKNLLEVTNYQIAVFNIWDARIRAYLGYKDFTEACSMMKLPPVDIIEVGDSYNIKLDQLLEKAKGKYPGTKNHREGLVIRPQKEEITEKGHRLSFKCINNEYLLKHGQ